MKDTAYEFAINSLIPQAESSARRKTDILKKQVRQVVGADGRKFEFLRIHQELPS